MLTISLWYELFHVNQTYNLSCTIVGVGNVEWQDVCQFCGAIYYAVQGGSNFKSVDKILKCDHSNENYWAVLSCGAVYYAVQGGSNFSVHW